MPLVKQSVQNKYLVGIQSFGLKQPVLSTRGVPIQQAIVTTIHVNILVTNELPIYGNGVPI
jgi:hypothetical protein